MAITMRFEAQPKLAKIHEAKDGSRATMCKVLLLQPRNDWCIMALALQMEVERPFHSQKQSRRNRFRRFLPAIGTR